MSKVLINESTLSSIADEIRDKLSVQTVYKPNQMPHAIRQIGGISPIGNIELTQQSGTDVTNYATASVRNSSIALNTPTINSSTGVVTASSTLTTSGWIDSALSSKTLNLSTQGAQTITPGTSNKTIASGKYLTGTQTISGDSNLIASNIKDGVTIFGVEGTYSGGGGTSSGVQAYIGYQDYRSSSLGATNLTITVAESGEYTVSWTGCRNTSSGTSGSQLYIDDSAYGSKNTSFTSTYWQYNSLTNVSLTAGQIITVYAQARSSSYHMFVGNLVIQKTS